MNADDFPTPETKPPRRRTPRRPFAKWFPAIGVLVGGGLFLWGLSLVFPPPPEPGTAYCGGEMLFGWSLALIVAPAATAIVSFGAWVIGVTLDDIRHDRGRPPSTQI
jgi:hypothetical protein